ncbi:MAG: outer membrane beta-barrel protein [Chitinophagales bacterium]
MKRFVSIFCMVFFLALQINAQEHHDYPEPTEYPNTSKDKFMVSLSFDNLFHKETNGFTTRWHSRGIGLHFMYDIPINNSKVSIAPGIGFSHSSYYHNSFIGEDSTGTFFTPIADFKDNDDFKRHKLTTNFIEIPLELRIRSNPDNKGNIWKVAFGFKAGLKLVATSKETRKIDGYFRKIKTKNYHDINLLRAGPTFRIGYGSFNLHAFYSVTNLFKKNKGPEMTPFSVGITFTAL